MKARPTRIDRSRKAKHVGFDELGDLDTRYLKGSDQPYTIADSAEHRYIRDHVDIESMSREEYYAGTPLWKRQPVAVAGSSCRPTWVCYRSVSGSQITLPR